MIMKRCCTSVMLVVLWIIPWAKASKIDHAKALSVMGPQEARMTVQNKNRIIINPGGETFCGPDSVDRWIGRELQMAEGRLHTGLDFSTLFKKGRQTENDGQDEIDPYYLSSDLITPFRITNATKEYPVGYFCGLSRDDEDDACLSIVNYTNEKNESEIMLASQPCTRCRFEYANSESCFQADCSIFDCRVEVGSPANSSDLHNDTNSSVDRSSGIDEGPESIEVCQERSRADFFSFEETRTVSYYACHMQTERFAWTTRYHLGVKFPRETRFLLREQYAPDDLDLFQLEGGDDTSTYDVCEFEVDGFECDCRLCDEDEVGFIAIDCSAIKEGAVTTCDSLFDNYRGLGPKLLTLQEDFILSHEEGSQDMSTDISPTTPRPTPEPAILEPSDPPAQQHPAPCPNSAGADPHLGTIVAVLATVVVLYQI